MCPIELFKIISIVSNISKCYSIQGVMAKELAFSLNVN